MSRASFSIGVPNKGEGRIGGGEVGTSIELTVRKFHFHVNKTQVKGGCVFLLSYYVKGGENQGFHHQHQHIYKQSCIISLDIK